MTDHIDPHTGEMTTRPPRPMSSWELSTAIHELNEQYQDAPSILHALREERYDAERERAKQYNLALLRSKHTSVTLQRAEAALAVQDLDARIDSIRLRLHYAEDRRDVLGRRLSSAQSILRAAVESESAAGTS